MNYRFLPILCCKKAMYTKQIHKRSGLAGHLVSVKSTALQETKVSTEPVLEIFV